LDECFDIFTIFRCVVGYSSIVMISYAMLCL